MIKTVLQFVGLAIVLVLVQVVFNKILLFGVAVPIVFIYLLLRLPVHTSVNWVMTIGFVLGLVIDVFSNTPGMNALACTILAAVRLIWPNWLSSPSTSTSSSNRSRTSHPRQ